MGCCVFIEVAVEVFIIIMIIIIIYRLLGLL